MKGIFLEIELEGEFFYLLHNKALYRPSKKQLILSDLHLGKAAHFRKQGIPLPTNGHVEDLERLGHLIRAWKPKSVLLLGDLFHSNYNREWLWFESFLREHPTVEFTLVIGNHDVLPPNKYELPNMTRISRLEERYFIFSHAPLDEPEKMNICGHVHPGLEIAGSARQSFKLPCFYSGSRHFIMPAFGKLTGLYLLEREKDSDYYLITRDTIVRV